MFAHVLAVHLSSHAVGAYQLPAPEMDSVMVVGFLCALAVPVCMIYQRQSRDFVLVLAGCLASLAVCGFLQNAWPLAIVQTIWAAATFRQWWTLHHAVEIAGTGRRRPRRAVLSIYRRKVAPSRMTQMFGPL
jgi:hypothetical protein